MTKIIQHGKYKYFTEDGKNVSQAVKEILKKERQRVNEAIDKILSKKYPQGIILNHQLKKELRSEDG